ncbi:MAG: hypothetical protein JO004_14430, partial [Methylobacteriaceae bacterium]|nr:hypothetical protein [Methylobacteriaceae bacterium]
MLEGFTLTVVAFAGIMRGITGFGGAMLMTPALGLIGSSGQTVLVVLILEAAAALVMIPEVYPDIRIT